MKGALALILGFFLTADRLPAQKMYFSNIPRLNSKAYYNKVIGENKGGIYVLRFRDPDLKGGFAIERYSPTLDFLESTELEFGKREKLIKVFTTDSGLCFVKIGFTKSEAVVTLLRTGYSLRGKQQAIEIYRSSSIYRNNELIKVMYSLNRRSVAIWIAEPDADGFAKLLLYRSDGESNEFTQSTLLTRLNYRQVQFGKGAVSNQGESILILETTHDDRRRNDPNQEEHFLVSASKTNNPKLNGLGDHRFFLSSYEAEVNEFTGEFEITGFYDYKKREGASGVVRYRFLGDSICQPEFQPFERRFVASLIGSKLENDGNSPEHFKVRKVIPRSDGGVLLVGEYFNVTQQMETFYLNGIPQTSSKSVYNYNDLIFISMDSAGNLEWQHHVNKRQSSFAGMSYLQSIGIYVCEKSVNLVYNDNSSQSNRVMHLKLTRDGVMESKIILNSENEYTAAIPMEGRQTGQNRFVTPLVQNRQTLLLQLIDTE